MMKNTALALGLALCTSFASFSTYAAQADHISVENPFAREVPPTAPASASFMTLHNDSGEEIAIIAAHSDVAKVIELHTHTNDNGVMRMRQIPKISIPANGTTELKPGGLHIMLIGPHNPIKVGQTVTVELEFKDGSRKTVDMPVKSFKKMMNHSMEKHENSMGGMKCGANKCGAMQH